MIELALLCAWLFSAAFTGTSVRFFALHERIGWSSGEVAVVLTVGVVGVSGLIGALLYWLRYVNLARAGRVVLPSTFRWLPTAALPGLLIGLWVGQGLAGSVENAEIEVVNRICTQLLCVAGPDGRVDLAACEPGSAAYRECSREAADCAHQALAVLDDPREQEQWTLDCTTSRLVR